MKKFLTLLILLVMPLSFALATRGTGTARLHIPDTAVEVAPHVFSLGNAIDPESGRVVQGYAFVYPKENYHHRPDHAGGPGGGGPGGPGGGGSTCYALLAKDAKWKNVEPWVVNASNNSGLPELFVLDNLALDMDEWESAANLQIFAGGSSTSDILVADEITPDGVNEVYFADIAGSGTIAVTITWGIFNGPPSQRELIEWDMVFDDVDFAWANDETPIAMDFENIAQHELGHALGLGHPDDSCTDETMFRFASEGETQKRDLNAGDIAGALKLY